MTYSDYSPSPTGINGLAYVTIGLPGSGASYAGSSAIGADSYTAFNSAVTFLQGLTPPGGTIRVLPGTYQTTKEWVLTGLNVRVVWDPAALLSPTVLNSSPNSPGGGNSGTRPFVVGGTSGAPCRGCRIDGGPITDGTAYAALNPASNLFGIFIGGNVYDLIVTGQRGTHLSNFSAWVNGYAMPNSTGVAYDGPCVNIRFVNRYSDSCGNAATPDGGGLKCSPESSVLGTATQAAIQTVIDENPIDTNCYFSAHDFTSGLKVGHTMDGLQVIGGFSYGNANTVGNGVFLEQGIAGTTTNVTILGHETYGFNVGFNMNTQSFVNVIGCTATNCGTAGFTTSLAVAAPATVYGHKYTGCRAVGCTTGYLFNTAPGLMGTSFWDMDMTDCTADDGGYAVMNSSLTINASVTKPIVGMRVNGCDLSRYASGGVPLTFPVGTAAACPGLSFSNCVGITDTGLLGTGNAGGFTTPLGTTQTFDCRNQGSLAKPANASTNTYRIRSPNTTIASTAGTGLSMTALSHWGNPLAGFGTNGTTATPAASTDYVTDSAGVLTVAVGTSSSLSITVFGPTGILLANGAATITALVIPAGSIINLGAFTGSPTITVVSGFGASATPFYASITAVAAFAATPFDYNSTLQFVTNTTSGTVTYTSNGAAVATPFFNYYECSLAGGNTTTVTANRVYDCTMVSYTISMGTTVAFSLLDQRNNALTNESTTAFVGRVPRGFRITCTTAGTALIMADNA